MKFKLILISCLMSYCGFALAENDYSLFGTVLAYDPSGNEVPLEGITVTAFYNGITQPSIPTDRDGGFKIYFPINDHSFPLEAGLKANLKIEGNRWALFSPRDGEIFIPKYSNSEKIKVYVIANNSSVVVEGLRGEFKSITQKPQKSPAHYVVQIINTKDEAKAQLAREELESINYPVSIKKINQKNNEAIYQVTAGEFTNWIDAQQHSIIMSNSFDHRYADCFVKSIPK